MVDIKISSAEIKEMLQLVQLEANEHATVNAAPSEPLATPRQGSPANTYGNHGFTLLTVDRFEQRAPSLRRIWFKTAKDCPTERWMGPNMAVRLEIPVQPDEFVGVEGAPTTASRAYTVAEVDVERQQIAIDFVEHGDASPVMRWLKVVEDGSQLHVWTPKQHKVPLPANSYLLVADSTALPAALSILREGLCGTVTLVTDADPLELSHDYEFLAKVKVVFATDLVEAVCGQEWPGVDWVWACGEAGKMKQIRRYSRDTLNLRKNAVQVYGYWKRSVSFTSIDVGRMRRLRDAMAQGLDLNIIEQEMEEDL